MKHKIWFGIVGVIFLMVPSVHAHEFVKEKKVKKESSSQIKQDIAELLELISRQLGSNIQESVTVQHQIFDQLKEVMGDGDHSTVQLKELRKKLEACLKKLEEQFAELHNILLTCK